MPTAIMSNMKITKRNSPSRVPAPPGLPGLPLPILHHFATGALLHTLTTLVCPPPLHPHSPAVFFPTALPDRFCFISHTQPSITNPPTNPPCPSLSLTLSSSLPPSPRRGRGRFRWLTPLERSRSNPGLPSRQRLVCWSSVTRNSPAFPSGFAGRLRATTCWPIGRPTAITTTRLRCATRAAPPAECHGCCVNSASGAARRSTFRLAAAASVTGLPPAGLESAPGPITPPPPSARAPPTWPGRPSRRPTDRRPNSASKATPPLSKKPAGCAPTCG